MLKFVIRSDPNLKRALIIRCMNVFFHIINDILEIMSSIESGGSGAGGAGGARSTAHDVIDSQIF